jgi:hypothetical protein
MRRDGAPEPFFCWLQGEQTLAGHTQQDSKLACRRPTALPPPEDTKNALFPGPEPVTMTAGDNSANSHYE